MSALHTLYAWITWIAFVLGVRYLVGTSKILLPLRLAMPAFFAWPVKRLARAGLERAAKKIGEVITEGPGSEEYLEDLRETTERGSRVIAWVVFVFVHDGLRCPACMGFWTGVAFYPMLPIALPATWARALLSGLCGMLLATWFRSLHARELFDSEEDTACRFASALGLNIGCENFDTPEPEQHTFRQRTPEETDDETTPQEASDRSDG